MTVFAILLWLMVCFTSIVIFGLALYTIFVITITITFTAFITYYIISQKRRKKILIKSLYTSIPPTTEHNRTQLCPPLQDCKTVTVVDKSKISIGKLLNKFVGIIATIGLMSYYIIALINEHTPLPTHWDIVKANVSRLEYTYIYKMYKYQVRFDDPVFSALDEFEKTGTDSAIVDCYVNPNNPSESILSIAYHIPLRSKIFIYTIYGAILILVICYIYTKKQKKPKHPKRKPIRST